MHATHTQGQFNKTGIREGLDQKVQGRVERRCPVKIPRSFTSSPTTLLRVSLSV
ncbi:Hypothetical protein FKW44_008239 [Caligus rogercresseyi]|uniref:Uncharacterized protein n=1 Tax=Caligus rogercresseyi TaxID=217165 RepID=A0A7T8QU44_CALRO|nr:Hypothetical protein FKW44_008239 [Caligus rogercresseyi]